MSCALEIQGAVTESVERDARKGGSVDGVAQVDAKRAREGDALLWTWSCSISVGSSVAASWPKRAMNPATTSHGWSASPATSSVIVCRKPRIVRSWSGSLDARISPT